jgi:polyisoprenoid-binding protein YceI
LSARRLAIVLGAFCAAALAVACHRAEKRPDRTEPWLASAQAPASPSSSASPFLRRVHYELTASQIAFELPAKRARPRGRLGKASGELDVDLDDLSRTTGHVELELTTLEMLDASQLVDPSNTALALDWLELGASIGAERRATVQRVTYELGSLDAGHLVAAPSDDRPAARRELESHWAVRGELSLHGVRAPAAADVTLTLVPAPDRSAPPAELSIRSRRPLVVSLGTHDIRPRDGRGVPVAKDQGVIGDKVGREAQITFDLTFAPGR